MKPLYIIGAERSGTTLLRLILNNHSKICIPPEAKIFDLLNYKFGNRTDSFSKEILLDELYNVPLFETWELSKEKLDELLEKKDYKLLGFIDEIYSIYSYKKKPNSYYWGDKTPANTLLIKEIKQLFPHSKIIYIYRDGRDVTKSRLGLWEDNVHKSAFYWNNCISQWKSAMVAGVNMYIVKFEDLVINPIEEIKGVMQFLDLDYEPQQLNYYKKSDKFIPIEQQGIHVHTKSPIDKSQVAKWKKGDLNTSLLLQYLMFKNLYELGYEINVFGKCFSKKDIGFIPLKIFNHLFYYWNKILK